jgi:hypothetical protein
VEVTYARFVTSTSYPDEIGGRRARIRELFDRSSQGRISGPCGNSNDYYLLVTRSIRWKLIVGILVAALALGVFFIQERRCDDWRNMVRRGLSTAHVLFPAFLNTLNQRRPIGCAAIVEGQ